MSNSDTSTGAQWLAAARRQAWLLALFAALGLGAGGLVYAVRPVSFVAKDHVRVATLYGDRPVIGPLTAAVEARDPRFLRRAQKRAGVAGRLAVDGVYHTHLLAIRAFAAEPAGAVALVNAACALIVEDQNTLVEKMMVDAARRSTLVPVHAGEPDNHGSTSAVPPMLSRPAVRIGQAVVAQKASPFLGPLMAAGLGVTLVIGLVLAWWREVARAARK